MGRCLCLLHVRALMRVWRGLIVMEHMDIYDMDFDELMDYIGDGDPAEILG